MDHNESSPDFSEALLYRQNNKFIEGDVPEPHNAIEIQANLESYFGPPPSRLSLLSSGMTSVVQFVISGCFAFVFLFGGMYLLEIDRINTKVAGFVAIVGFGIGWTITSAILKLLPSKLFTVTRYTPAERASIYQTLCERGEVVNGTIVDVVNLLGNLMITYSVKSPTMQVVQHTYKTDAKTYTKDDVGKEVAVLYLNETVNVLL